MSFDFVCAVKGFTFGTVIGVHCLRGDSQFTVGFQEYLEQKGVDVTAASCTGHSLEGESEDIEILRDVTRKVWLLLSWKAPLP